MPRQPRIDLPGIAQDVIRRGNDRQPCFLTDADFQRYRTELRELALRHAFGPDRFGQAIEAQLGRPCGPRRNGRTPKAPAPPQLPPETAL